MENNTKQQTAVEWLIDMHFGSIEHVTPYFKKHIEEAKEMEKQQNKNYLKEYFEWHKSMGFVSHKPEDIIEYNETYGGNK
jgi:uncharacterized protein (UPF0128 family)